MTPRSLKPCHVTTRPPGWVGHRRKRARPPAPPVIATFRRRSARQALLAVAVGVLSPLTSLATTAASAHGVSPWLAVPAFYLALGCLARAGMVWAAGAPDTG